MQKIYPCDIGPDYYCPFDATDGNTCVMCCGLGIEEENYEEDYDE